MVLVHFMIACSINGALLSKRFGPRAVHTGASAVHAGNVLVVLDMGAFQHHKNSPSMSYTKEDWTAHGVVSGMIRLTFEKRAHVRRR